MEMNFFSDVAEAATRSKEVLPSVEYHNINRTLDGTHGYFTYGGDPTVNSVVGNSHTSQIINMTVDAHEKSVINGSKVYNLFDEDLEIHLDMNFGRTSTYAYGSKEYIEEMNRGMTVMLKGGDATNIPGGRDDGL